MTGLLVGPLVGTGLSLVLAVMLVLGLWEAAQDGRDYQARHAKPATGLVATLRTLL